MVTFYNYPKEHWRHLRTTNIVESPFAAVRLRTGASKRFKKTENAVALIWKVLLVVEKRFQPLAIPAMWKDVYNGTKYLDGEKLENSKHQNKESSSEKEPAA
jgi:transposase-like protein